MVRSQAIHPYHYRRVQDLRPEDFLPRVQFCRWILNNENVLPNILWSDEATFTRNGAFNMHNTHFWAAENPRVVQRTNFQHRFSINLWAAIIGDQLIGPIEIPNRLNANEYLNFLQNNLGELLEDVPINARLNMYYQHDGAPAHFGRNVRDWLDENFAGRWIGRGGPIAWPPRSPDLNPLDYHFWGHLNNLVYATEVNTLEELRHRIELADNQIRGNQFEILRASRAIRRRARICIQQNGNHFEQLLS